MTYSDPLENLGSPADEDYLVVDPIVEEAHWREVGEAEPRFVHVSEPWPSDADDADIPF